MAHVMLHMYHISYKTYIYIMHYTYFITHFLQAFKHNILMKMSVCGKLTNFLGEKTA